MPVTHAYIRRQTEERRKLAFRRATRALEILKVPQELWSGIHSDARNETVVRLRAGLVLFFKEHPLADHDLSWADIAEISGFSSHTGALAAYDWIRTTITDPTP